MEIIKSSEFHRHSKNFQNKRKIIKDKKNLLNKTIEENTKNEKIELNQAIQKLNNKVKSILEHPTVKKETQKLAEDEKDMFMSLSKCMNVFQQARESILSNNSLNNKEKQKYLASLERKIMEKLYTEEEVNQFQNMINNLIIIQPPQNLLQDRNFNDK